MPVKPSDAEEEYFVRLEVERRRKLAEQRQAAELTQPQERESAPLKCPRCGTPLEEIAFGDVQVDKCFGCEGIWLDKGELETIQKKESGFVNRLLDVFR
jgi:hypothetical protein